MIAGRNWSDNIETYIVYLVVLISLDLQGKRSFEAGIEREVRIGDVNHWFYWFFW